MLWKSKKKQKNASFFSFWKKFPAYWIYKKKFKKRGERSNVKKYKKQ